MGDPGMIVLFTVLLPVIGAGLVLLLRKNENAREAATLITGVVTFLHVLGLLRLVRSGDTPRLDIIEVVPDVWLSFAVEPLGMVFALVAGFLWPVTSLYAIGYMRGHHEENQTRFFFFFAIAIAGAMGVAFSANLFTLFVFWWSVDLLDVFWFVFFLDALFMLLFCKSSNLPNKFQLEA